MSALHANPPASPVSANSAANGIEGGGWLADRLGASKFGKLSAKLASWVKGKGVRCQAAATSSAPIAAAAILSAAKPLPLAVAAIPAPLSLVTMPSPPAPAPLAAVPATTALPSLSASAAREPAALDPLMADYRNESDPAKRSEMAALIIAERDAFESRRFTAPSQDLGRRVSARVANLVPRSPEPVENHLPGLPAPRSVSGASALIAQMIATQDRAERSELAGRVCASLKASIGHDDAMANYAREADPAKRSDIAQQIIAAREYSADLAELRSLLVQFEGAHSLESRAGIFSQVTLTARRCGLL